MKNKLTWFLFLLWTSWIFSSVLFRFRSVERSKISDTSNNSCWERITSLSSLRAQADEWPTIKLPRKLAKKKYISSLALCDKRVKNWAWGELLRPPMFFSKNIFWILVVLWTVLPSSFPKQSIGFPYLWWKVWTWTMFSRHSGLRIPLSGSTPKLLNQNKSNNKYIILLSSYIYYIYI